MLFSITPINAVKVSRPYRALNHPKGPRFNRDLSSPDSETNNPTNVDDLTKVIHDSIIERGVAGKVKHNLSTNKNSSTNSIDILKLIRDQFSFNSQSLKLQINFANMKETLDEYLNLDNLRMLINRNHPNPKTDAQTLIGDSLLTRLNKPYGKSDAESLCNKLSQQLFEPRTQEDITFLQGEQVTQLWVNVKEFSPSSANYYVYMSNNPVPAAIGTKDTSFGDNATPTCLTFNTVTFKYVSPICTKKFPVFCAKSAHDYKTFLTQSAIYDSLLLQLGKLSQWYESNNFATLLKLENRTLIPACNNSINVFENTYPSLIDTTGRELEVALSRFLTKMDWIQKFLYFAREGLNSQFFSNVGLNIEAVIDNTVCITVASPSPFLTHSFYNFTVTDLSLAICTLLVAALSCIHTYKKYGRCKNNVSPSSSPSSEDEEQEMQPLARQIRAVSFADDIYRISPDDTHSISPSFAPEEELFRYA